MCILFIKFLGNQFNHHSLRKPSPRLGMGTTRMPHFGQPPVSSSSPAQTLSCTAHLAAACFFSPKKNPWHVRKAIIFSIVFLLYFITICVYACACSRGCQDRPKWVPGGCEPLGLGAEEEQWSSVRPPWFYSILGLYSYGFSEQLKHLTILKRLSIKLPYELEAEICKNSVH